MQAAETKSPASIPALLSVLVPVSDDFQGDLEGLHQAYLGMLDGMGRPFELIYVLDGCGEDVHDVVRKLGARDPRVRAVALRRWYGESTALGVGVEVARGDVLMTLPAYWQVDAASVPRIVELFEKTGADMVAGRRWPRSDSLFNRMQAAVFHWAAGLLSPRRFSDLSCAVRIMRRAVAEEVELYGDRHRFLPILAHQKGFRVEECPLPQSERNVRTRIFRPGVYVRRLLDLLSLFFLVKFTKKPLRFFGLLGVGVFLAGFGVLVYLTLYKLLGFGGIGDRPLLVLGVLLVVVGVQLFSIGLLGEMIIFTHARSLRDYQVKEVWPMETPMAPEPVGREKAQ